MHSFSKLAFKYVGLLLLQDDPTIFDWNHLRLETFTIAFPAGRSPPHWHNGDCFQTIAAAPTHMVTPRTPRGEDQIYEWKNLRMETFTIAFPAEISSPDWQCTKRLYKAAHRSSTTEISVDQVVHVSLSPQQHTCKLFVITSNYPETLDCKFCCRERKLQRRPVLHRHKVKLTGFASKGLNKLLHALNGNIHFIKWTVPALVQDPTNGSSLLIYQMVW